MPFTIAKIEITVARQETGAGIMADAYARLTGKVGVFFTTRGPGAMNAAHAIHIAEHDSVPLIMFVGQIERSMRGRGAFQEVDYEKVFGSMAKWAVEVNDPARIPRNRFSRLSCGDARPSGTGGHFLAGGHARREGGRAGCASRRSRGGRTWCAGARKIHLVAAIRKTSESLSSAAADGERLAVRQFQEFAQRYALPVACSFRRTNLFDAEHECYAGELALSTNPKLLERIKSSDLVVLVGGRLAEVPSQSYTLIDLPNPRQTFVHVHADPEELGRVYRPHLGINATPKGFCAALEKLVPASTPSWAGETAQAHRDYLAFSDNAPEMPGDVQLSKIMLWLRERLPQNAIVTNGAGNYTIWNGRYLRMRHWQNLLAPVSGSMGYGLPAAVGAKRVLRNRMVVSFNGDGCFLMNGQEFATAVQYDCPIIAIVIDNSIYGTIRMHQEREYPGRVSATSMRSPDFAALARGYGGHGETVEKNEDFAPAFERCAASGVASLIHVKIASDAISPVTTLTAIREKALKG